MVSLTKTLRQATTGLSDISYWSNLLRDRYGLILVDFDSGCYNLPFLARQLYIIFSPIPPSLVKDCGIRSVTFHTDMGPNKPYYPNHGYYRDNQVGLNADCFYHPDQPDDFMDHRGYFVNRGQQTVLHEFGHGYDAYHGELSVQPGWCALSGWSSTAKPGLKRILIKEPKTPPVLGEWYYSPKAGFTRFYGKRNPWDDFADCFSFYLAGLRGKMPENKQAYLEALLKPYQ